MSQVTDLELFHVTRNVFHSDESPIKDGDCIEVGERHNPFYSFYEKPRSYPVNENGQWVQVPAMQFLSRVVTGNITTDNLPAIAKEVALHYLMLSRELIMEQVRQEVASDAPSRQRCLWMTETEPEARHWQIRLGGESRIVRFRATGVIHRADASLLLAESEPISETFRKAHLYWMGQQSDKPEWETLFIGSASVIEIFT